MKRPLDMDKIARELGAARTGKVSATGGYFGAMQLLADVKAKFRVPRAGGRPTDPPMDGAATRAPRSGEAQPRIDTARGAAS